MATEIIRWFRSFASRGAAFAVACLLVVSSAGDGIAAMGRVTGDALLISRLFPTFIPPESLDTVIPAYAGDNPSRDDTTRWGIWDTDTRLMLGELEAAQEANSNQAITDEPAVPVENYPDFDPGYEEELTVAALFVGEDIDHFVTDTEPSRQETEPGDRSDTASTWIDREFTGEGNPRGGVPYSWELSFDGGGSVGVDAIVNSNTGNRLTTVHLFSIPLRGGFEMEMNLYHSSQTNFGGQFGWDWSCSFDARLQIAPGEPTSGQLIVLRRGDGTPLPFSYNSATSKYMPPKGFYDVIERTQSGNDSRWVLTTKYGIAYKFRTVDGSGSNKTEAILEAISWPGSSSNVIDIQRSWNGSARINKVRGPNNRSISFGHSLSGVGSVSLIKDSLYTGGSNRKWQFEYSSGRLTKIKNPVLPQSGGSIYFREFSYDSSRNITSETALNGGIFTNSYTGDVCTGYVLKRNSTIQDGSASFSYGSTSTTHHGGSSGTVTHHYSGGAIAKTTDGLGFEDQYGFTLPNRLRTTYRDRRGATWIYSFDSNGNTTRILSPNGDSEYAGFNADNTLEHIKTDLTPSTVRFQYTNRIMNRAYRDLAVDEDLVTNSIGTSDGLIWTTTEHDGTQSRTYSYNRNGYGDVHYTTDPNNCISTTPHNEMGWPEYIVDEMGRTTDIVYDNWGRIERLTYPDNKYVEYGYDLEGNVTSVRDERGKTQYWTYNARGQILTYTNARGDVETNAYYNSGFRYSLTNGRNYTRYYEPNSRNEVRRMLPPGGGEFTYSYNGNGEMDAHYVATPGAGGWVTKYEFDASGRLTKIDYPTGTDTVLAYSNYGRTIAMSDASGTTTWTYDSWDDLESVASPQGTVTYEYNRLGERTKLTESGVGDTIYQYDKFGRLKQLTNHLSEVSKWNFDDAGRMWKRELANGTWEENTFDSRDRLTQILLRKSGPTTLRTTEYGYDDVGNITSCTVDGVATAYTYDDSNQLLSENRTGYSCAYTYDSNGNRLTRALNGVVEIYESDANDFLDTIRVNGNIVKSFTFDLAGRRQSMTESGATTIYNWDYESRLTSVVRSSVTIASYTYSGLNARISATDSGGERWFKRDGPDVTDGVLSESVTGGATTRFTPSISEQRSGTSRFLHSGIKNAEARTSGGANVEASRAYDAFGNITNSSGTWQGFLGYGGQFGYQEDSVTGLTLLGHRYYDAASGRFLTLDPAMSGRNWYSYCDNNPVEIADPDGRILPALVLIGALLVASGGVAHAPGPGHDAAAAERKGRDNLNGMAIEIASNVNPASKGPGVLSKLLNLSAKNSKSARKSAAILAKANTPAAKTKKIEVLTEQAKKRYPGKADRNEFHHIDSLYIGGDPKGKLSHINAAYHQLITNEIAKHAPFGTGILPKWKRDAIMKKVYAKYPIPGYP